MLEKYVFSIILRYNILYVIYISFPGGSDSKESACNVGDLGSIPGPGRFPGRGYDKPLQDSCLENQRSLEGSSPQGHAESDTTEQLSMRAHAF